MKKITAFFLLLSLLALAITACGGEENENNDTPPSEFEMTATVLELGEKILVEVTEAEYAEGTYLINISDTAMLINAKGKKIEKSDLAVGDTVKIWYTGQVTMSIPPQIIALKIQKQ